MCEERLERSDEKDDEDEGMVAPGTIVSLDMVARRPRWLVEDISSPRADWSSLDAGDCQD
jgi:hypothetical protein